MPKKKGRSPTAAKPRCYDNEMAEDECAKRHLSPHMLSGRHPPPGCEIRIVPAETLLGPFNMDFDQAMMRHRCRL